MADQAAEKVFQNDYIMVHILRMLNLKQQFELQKICQRLQFLVVTCVWRRDCKEMQINRKEMYRFTNDEYFELLLLNSFNVLKLTIREDDDVSIQKYFPAPYPDLLEVHIKGFEFDANMLLIIAKNCPRLQLFEYIGICNGRILYKVVSLEILQTLTNLRALLLKNVRECSISDADLYLLATKVPLERMELCDVNISEIEWDVQRTSLDLHNMNSFKINSRVDWPSHLEFIKKCPKLQELEFGIRNLHELEFGTPCHILDDVFFAQFKFLKKINIFCSVPLLMSILRDTKVKILEINNHAQCINLTFKIPEEDRELGGRLRVVKSDIWHLNAFWPMMFQSSSTNFESLLELTISWIGMNDDFIRTITLKSPILKVLHLDECRMITGKYINKLTTIERLTVRCKADAPVSWSELYSMLRDLKFLQYLEIDCASSRGDELAILQKLPEEPLANSLETLKITQGHFWNLILRNCCEESFKNMCTLYFKFDELYDGDIDDYSKFKPLRTLHLTIVNGQSIFDYYLNSSEVTPTFKHLVCINCRYPQWSDMVKIFKSSGLETFEMVGYVPINIERFYKLSEYDFKNIKLRKVIIPSEMFEKTHLFWQRCLEECQPLQLCCIGHMNYACFLEAWFKDSAANKRVLAIHVTHDLKAITNYCARYMGPSTIQVYCLDEDNIRVWNPRYMFKNVMVIETD